MSKNTYGGRLQSCLHLLVGMVCGLTASAWAGADWPCFLGPTATGISPEHIEHLEWSTQAPKTLWERQIGTGFSSCAIVGGQVFVSGHAGGQDTFFCLDAATGKTAWSHRYPCRLVDNLHEGGPAATATVHGNEVYFCSKEGHLFCFNKADGTIRWMIELQKTLGVKMPEWGFAGSARIHEADLLLDAGPLCAFDRMTGQLKWKTKAYRCGYGSPTLFMQDGVAYCAVLNNDGLLVVDSRSGKEVAFHPWVTNFETNATTPIYHDGHLFISTAYNKGCSLLKFDGKTLDPVYTNKEMRNHMANGVRYEGHVYGFDRTAHRTRRLATVTCMEWNTGAVKWRSEPGALGCGNLSAAGEHLIILSDSGELLLAEAKPDGFTVLARKQVLDGRCWTMPVLANQRIYARNAKGRLVCVDVSK